MLLYAQDQTVCPQQSFPFHKQPNIIGVDNDGETIRTFNLERELNESYFVLFFFPMDFRVDASEVLSFSSKLSEFLENRIIVLGATQDNPQAIKRWLRKDPANGGFGKPVGFPILSDKDSYLANLLGVSSHSGMPCR